jgi:alcohol dehydrogenase class IV
MWIFGSPKIIYGEDALCYLEELSGKRAFIVTDPTIKHLGFVERVQTHLAAAGIQSEVFAEVEADPSIQTALRCGRLMADFAPDWVVGLGGGSSIDAAKAAWLVYERPDIDPAAINPFDDFGLRAKARLMAIPTTSGTGAEVTMATVLTDSKEQRKLGLASYELVPDLAIVDPSLAAGLPPEITADSGLDALTHAIEGYTSLYHNDFCDGLCLQAVKLVFEYLPRAYKNGADSVARERMHNAATMAGLGFGNSMAALAHAMGHSLGAVFHIPHGRSVSMFLPYTMEFTANGGESRYADIAQVLGFSPDDEAQATMYLVDAIRELERRLNQPLSIPEAGVTERDFERGLASLVANAEADTSLIMNARIPDSEELEQLYRCAFYAKVVDF